MPKITAYIRVSTNKQDEASQREIISSTLAGSSGEPVEWVSDTASGGTPWQERAIAGVLERGTTGDTIIVSEVSRIARSTVGVLTFLQAAAEKKITVVAVRSGITLDGSAASKIVVTVLAMAAEIERDLLRERTRAALADRKAKGVKLGRPTGSTGKSSLDPHADAIKKLLAAQVSHAAIGRTFGKSRQTVAKWIANNITQGTENDPH